MINRMTEYIQLNREDIPEGTVMKTGSTIIIEFYNVDDANKAFDILETLLHDKDNDDV